MFRWRSNVNQSRIHGVCDFSLSLCVRKPTIWVPTRSDTNRAVQSQKMVRGWKFWTKKVEELYYPFSENKGAALLCFRMCKLLVFPCGGSFNTNLVDRTPDADGKVSAAFPATFSTAAHASSPPSSCLWTPTFPARTSVLSPSP